MAHIVTHNHPTREVWLTQLAQAISDPVELLQLLALEHHADLKKGLRHDGFFRYGFPVNSLHA